MAVLGTTPKDRYRVLMGRASRRKGYAFERWVANKLSALWAEAKRGIGQTRQGSECCDVENTPYWVECKRHKRVSVSAAWRQATAATDGRPILVVHRSDREPELVTLSLEEFMKLWTRKSDELPESSD